jgi:hypothetical protein
MIPLGFQGLRSLVSRIDMTGRMKGECSRLSSWEKQKTPIQSLMAQTMVEGEEHRNWAMEIYQDKGKRDPLEEVGKDILELDLGDADEELVKKHMAIAIYYSQKSFNPQYLFFEMMSACGIQSLASLKKIEDYTFKLEFHREEEKVRVIEGGPWRHKGDVLIVMHYDGFSRPSEIRVENIALLIRLYDLPLVMMKNQWRGC